MFNKLADHDKRSSWKSNAMRLAGTFRGETRSCSCKTSLWLQVYSTDLLKFSGGLMSVGELSSLLDLLSSVLLLPPSLSAFWLSVSDMASALKTQRKDLVRTNRWWANTTHQSSIRWSIAARRETLSPISLLINWAWYPVSKKSTKIHQRSSSINHTH